MLARFPSLRLLLALTLASLSLGVSGARADLKTGQDALRHGHWAEAEKDLQAVMGADRPRALLALGELYQTTGRCGEAVKLLTPLWKEPATAPAVRGAAGALIGELQRDTGQMAAARATLEAALKLNPKNLRTRMALGLVLRDTGQKAAADAVFKQFFQDFNSGAIDQKQPEALTYVAMAARFLESWQDANDTFRDAAKLNREFVLANLEWAELFLQTYNTAEASKCLRDVLSVNPNQPRALLGMARIKIEDSYDVDAATDLIEQALKQNPHDADAFTLQAQLYLDNEEFPKAEAEIAKALTVNPAHLRALALKATSRYLQDDHAGYDALCKQVLTLNPRYSELYVIVGAQAVRQHRYQEGITLDEKALSLDPDDAVAHAELGIGMLRQTEEEKGVEQLRKAFDRDPFNVRTANMLKLFEEIIPRDYEVITAGPLRIRMNKKERPLLERYVPGLVQRAWQTYVAKYHFTPQTPLTIELFTEPEHFAVRTVGLPEMGASGVCFGRLVTAPTPLRGDVNWEQVLWHETGHVFALQLSGNRVSRWFTEGLSEYETMVARPEWKRHHDVELYQALHRGDLPTIEDLNAAFTRARYRQNIVRAYYEAALLINYLVETYGFDKIVEALKLYGKGGGDAKVLPAVYGKSLPELDAGFHAHLEKLLAPWGRGFYLDHVAYYDTERFRREAQAKPQDAPAQAALAVALFTDKKLDAAKAQAEKALGIDAKNATARYLLAEIALGENDGAKARQELETLLQQGADGYSVQVLLGQIALAEKKDAEAIDHLKQAQAFDPDKEETYTHLIVLYTDAKKPEEVIDQLRKIVVLNPHDFTHTLMLVKALAEAGKWDVIPEYASMATAINPSDAAIHELWGRGLAKQGKHAEAVPELETALLCEPEKKAPIQATLAQSYLALGQKEKAKAAAQAALAEDPNNAEAKAVVGAS